jgi:hypothetical protein
MSALFRTLMLLGVCLALCSPTIAADWDADQFDKLLAAGKLTEAVKLADAELQAHGDNDQARFALGVAQTLNRAERLIQGLYRYGLQPAWASDLPIVAARAEESQARAAYERSLPQADRRLGR